jgi:hypothetical protein
MLHAEREISESGGKERRKMKKDGKIFAGREIAKRAEFPEERHCRTNLSDNVG